MRGTPKQPEHVALQGTRACTFIAFAIERFTTCNMWYSPLQNPKNFSLLMIAFTQRNTRKAKYPKRRHPQTIDHAPSKSAIGCGYRKMYREYVLFSISFHSIASVIALGQPMLFLSLDVQLAREAITDQDCVKELLCHMQSHARSA